MLTLVTCFPLTKVYGDKWALKQCSVLRALGSFHTILGQLVQVQYNQGPSDEFLFETWGLPESLYCVWKAFRVTCISVLGTMWCWGANEVRYMQSLYLNPNLVSILIFAYNFNFFQNKGGEGNHENRFSSLSQSTTEEQRTGFQLSLKFSMLRNALPSETLCSKANPCQDHQGYINFSNY